MGAPATVMPTGVLDKDGLFWQLDGPLIWRTPSSAEAKTFDDLERDRAPLTPLFDAASLVALFNNRAQAGLYIAPPREERVPRITVVLHLPRREPGEDGAVVVNARCGHELSSATAVAHLATATIDRFKAYVDPENDLTLMSHKDLCADCVSLLRSETEGSEA